jgi:hypothetical protein
MNRATRVLWTAVLCPALSGLVALGCTDSGSTTRSTTGPLVVDKTGFVVTSTTAATALSTDRCAAPPDTEVAPPSAERRCDSTSGWRLAQWIGESGDGIIQLERHVDGEWVVVAYGPYCGGVAAITHAALRDLGAPEELVHSWGVDASVCARPGPPPAPAAADPAGATPTLSA